MPKDRKAPWLNTVPPEQQCGAAPRPGGQRKHNCKKRRMVGATRCRLHGGKSKATAARRAEAEAEDKARKALRKLDIRPVEDPLSALKELAGEAIGWKEVIAEKVAELEHIRYKGEQAEQVRAEVAIYERAMDRCNTVLGTIARLKIDERLAAISERQAEMLEHGLMAAFQQAGIPITDQETRLKVAREFRRHLMLVS